MDEILSVSIINQDGEELLNTLCNTERKKSWYGAQRIHGISPQDVQGYPTFSQILPQVLEILSSVDFVIAYNIVFEYGFVKSYIQITNPQYFSDYDINWALHKDPMDMYAKHVGSRKWIKLSEAAKSFGYNFNPHDSLEDVKATLFLYNQLK
jgi:DNA polymerase-3 subunit epsilon